MRVRLGSLTLEGFKSFAGKVELTFPGNFIAIVGPNGAGKSNICDAIAWVLGEQSARLLRSQTMGEVIFAGSAQRPPASAAQVTLVLENPAAHADGRMEVGRRILRDGSSEYRLGGRRVRLKDLQDKLAEAGLATRAYAIIEQGRIAQVLSARPTDRRALFEEAAGISHYRLRRQEAELKLAETKANLERVSDIVAEVRREFTTIRRQARQAERHAQMRTELQQVQQALAALHWAEAKGQLDAVQAQLAAAQEEHAQQAAALARAEEQLLRHHRRWEAAAEELARIREEWSQLVGACQRLEAEESSLRRELERLRERQEQLTAELAQTEATTREERAREDELAHQVLLAQDELRQVQEQTAQAETLAEEAEQQAQGAETRAEAARQELLQAVAAAAEARNRYHRLQLELEQLQYQQGRLKTDQERLGAHLQQAGVEEELAEEAERQCLVQREALQGQQRQLQQQVETSRREQGELARQRDQLEHRFWQVRHELEAVQRARAQLRAMPESLGKMLPAEYLAGSVADYLNPPPHLAPLLDRAYGHLLTLPVVQGEEAVRALLAAPPPGETLEVAVRDTQRPGPHGHFLEQAGTAPEERGWLTALLPPFATAQDSEQAASLAQDPFLVVLLPNGGRRQGQWLRLGNGGRIPSGALQLKQKEQELTVQERALAQQRQQLAQRWEEMSQSLQAQEQALAELHRLVQQASQSLAEATSRREAKHRERVRLEREVEALHVEEARLAEELTNLANLLAQVEEQARRLEERAEEAAQEVDEAAGFAAKTRAKASQCHTEAEKWRGKRSLAAERVSFAQRELERHQRLARQLAEQGQRLRRELEQVAQRQGEVTQALADTRTKLAQALRQAERCQKRAVQAESQASALKTQVDQQQRETGLLRQQEQESQRRLHQLEVQLAAAAAQLAHAQQSLGGLPPAQLPDPASAPQLRERQRLLQDQLAQMGPVNELAVVQEQELGQRLKFLSEQKKDLERSLASLQETIRQLDETSKERFLHTLREANRNFGEVFRELFGGGEAYVALSDPENPLESGVDVKVRPPGKHTQSVLLLSGGEKALAAVALLLALFRIRPAPFCVLDEVDAPLDDLNVERLCHHLKAQAEQTQFLIITHNRRTMAHADVLYGVTMEEPGVSRVVSVRLEEP